MTVASATSPVAGVTASYPPAATSSGAESGESEIGVPETSDRPDIAQPPAASGRGQILDIQI